MYFRASYAGVNGQPAVMAAQRGTQGLYSLRNVLNPSRPSMAYMEVAGAELWSIDRYTAVVHSWPTHGATQATLRGFEVTSLFSGLPGIRGVLRRMAVRCSLASATAFMLSMLSLRRFPPESSLGK